MQILRQIVQLGSVIALQVGDCSYAVGVANPTADFEGLGIEHVCQADLQQTAGLFQREPTSLDGTSTTETLGGNKPDTGILDIGIIKVLVVCNYRC